MIELITTFWQWSILIVLIVIGFILNKIDNTQTTKKRVDFKYKFMPVLTPLPIKTKGKGFWKGILLWLMGTRQWKLEQDFNYSLHGEDYKIPAGFEFDGASVPKFLATFLSPVGVLLMGGLVHDYGYKYATLQTAEGGHLGYKDQKYMDQLFRDICIEVNGFYVLNYLAYYALRLAGFVAWNGHKKRGTHVKQVNG